MKRPSGTPWLAALLSAAGSACSQSKEPLIVARALGPDRGGTPTAMAALEPVAVAVRAPSPLISRALPVVSSPPGGERVVDGVYHGGGWYLPSVSEDAPAWVALPVPGSPARLLLSWDDGGTYNYRDNPDVTVYGLPAAYHIDVSADSTTGSDGQWRTVVDVQGNRVRTRSHSFDFVGQRWVRLVITAAPPTANQGAVSIGEIDLHDLSASAGALPDDTWLLLGDSITAFAYDRIEAHQPSFAQALSERVGGFFPAMINAGIGGETTRAALARLPDDLALAPDYRFVVLGYGTNDSTGAVPLDEFRQNLQAMIELVREAGRVPLVPRIPPAPDGQHDAIGRYNEAIDALVQDNDLPVAADLQAALSDGEDYFTCAPCVQDRMTDNLHPNDAGLRALNRAWAESMRRLYP